MITKKESIRQAREVVNTKPSIWKVIKHLFKKGRIK